MTETAWECVCGNVEYKEIEPEECIECGKIGNFTQLPEELMEEREKEGDIQDFDVKPVKLKSKSPKLNKPKRRKL